MPCDAIGLWSSGGDSRHWMQVRMLLPKRQIKARTFRASAGQTIFLGGLARLDLLQLPAQTIYLTVWASDEVTCHYGRTDKADERCAQHSIVSLLLACDAMRSLLFSNVHVYAPSKCGASHVS